MPEFECPEDKCAYETDSERGVKVHYSKKHDGSLVEKYEYTCVVCGKDFTRKASNVDNLDSEPSCCSQECYHNKRNTQVEYECDNCGEPFKIAKLRTERSDNNYCSRNCHDEHKKEKSRTVCQFCGKEFNSKGRNRKYCSQECYGKSERKEKFEVECDECGSSMKRLKSTIEGREKIYCSRACQFESYKSDSPDFTSTKEGIEWRESVFERDDYTCQDCGERGVKLNAHHIKRRATHPELATDVDNGVTLCIECHANRHEEAGEERIATLIRSNLEQP